MKSIGRKLNLEQVRKTYGGPPVLEDISLEIPAGCFCTLLGASGSGKSTLLKLIAGFETPDAGRILVDGQDIAPVPVRHRNIGMVFQNFALFPHMSAARNVAFGLEMRRLRRHDIAARVHEALTLVGLDAFSDRMPRQLSGGQQQRVALARALVIEPDILLMDEPLGALDKTLRQGLQEELRSLHARLGVTIVFVTHDQEEALHLSDLLVVMERGRIAQSGVPRELYEAPATRFVAAFLGECNEFKLDGTTYALRPERVRLASAAVTLPHRIEGRVEDMRFLGPSLRVVMQTSQGRFIALVAANGETAEIAVGQTTTAGFRSQDLAALRG
jgi:putative spermidine/putrescine transport system ATP-binding protein